jgi:hypothetical protein
MIQIELILLNKVTNDANPDDYDFVDQLLGTFKVEAVPRIGETVFYEVDEEPGYFYVKDIQHHIAPVAPIRVVLISPEDEEDFE